MKVLVSGMMFVIASSAFAATAPQDCMKIKNSLDRRYCTDKYLESVKDSYSSESKTWSAGISQTDKDSKITNVQDDLASKKDYINMLQNEIALEEKHLEALKAAPIAATAAPVEVKKKKKHKGFRIKL